MNQSGVIEHINPDGLHRNPAFTWVITATSPSKTIYIGEQNATDPSGNVVGIGDLKAQTEQTFANLQIALAAAGADLGHIVSWTIYVLQGQPLEPGLEVFQRVWGQRANPPTITFVYVAGLHHPDVLIGINAIAVVPQ